MRLYTPRVPEATLHNKEQYCIAYINRLGGTVNNAWKNA